MPVRNPEGIGAYSCAFAAVSLALGAAALCMPRKVVRAIGAPETEESERAVRAVGARELVSAAGLAGRPGKPGWMWSRVAGDAMDLALLGGAMRARDAERKRLALAMLAVAGVAAFDVWASLRMTRAVRSRAL